MILLLFLLGAIALPAPGAVAESPWTPTRYPLTVADDSGTAVTLPSRPKRIISLTLPTDEILLSLVDASRILAVTTLAADPGISNVSAQASRIPHTMTLSVEPIIAMHPDLVFTASWSDLGAVSQLREAGVPVYLIASATTVAAVEQVIRRCALLTGESQKGAALVAHMEEMIAAVEKKTASIPREKRLSVLDYTTFGASMGRGSSWDDIVRLAGLVNAAAAIVSDGWGQVPVSTEKLLTVDPDILILPGWVYGDPHGAAAFFNRVVTDPALRGLSAVKAGRVYMMPENLRACTSQYIADAVQWLARTAYPGMFH